MVGGVFRWVIDGLGDYEIATEAVRSIRDWAPGVVAGDRWVSVGQRALFMVNRVEAYRYAGGYVEALRWTEPMVVALAIDGARLVGAEDYATLLEEAVAVVFPAGLPRNERDDRLGHLLLDVFRGLLFVRTANLADQRHDMCLRVGLEHLQRVDKSKPMHRIATDSDTSRLSDLTLG